MAAFPRVSTERPVSIQQQLVPFQSGTSRGPRFTHIRDQRAHDQMSLIDQRMMMAIWQHGFNFGRKLQALEDRGDFLSRDKIQFEAEMRTTKLFDKEWPLHVQSVKAQVETIYTKFKALDEKVKQDHAAVEGPLRLASQSKITLSDKEKGAMGGIEAVCNLYRYSLGFVFPRVERCYQNFTTFVDSIPLEPVIPANIPGAQLVHAPEHTNALENVSDEITGFLHQREHDLQVQIQPLQKINSLAEDRNYQLKKEGALLKATQLKAYVLFHEYLRIHLDLTMPYDYAYKNLRSCGRTKKPDPSEEGSYTIAFHYQMNVADQAAKILPKWDEIALLITQLVEGLDP